MSLVFINSKYVFSLFPNLMTVNKPIANVDINQLIEAIKYGYLKDKITTLRASSSKEEYNQIKKESIPCVTISGVFTYRAATGLVNHSGLIQIDIDKVEDYDSGFEKLCKDNYIYLCFRSPGGKGIKAIVKINPSLPPIKANLRLLKYILRTNIE